MPFNKDRWFPEATKGSRGFSTDADNAMYNSLKEKVLADERERKQSLGGQTSTSTTTESESGLKKVFRRLSNAK